MQKIKEVIGLTQISGELQNSLELIRKGYFQRIDAARRLSEQIILGITDPLLHGVLSAPATSTDSSLWPLDIIGDEMPTMSVLEQILLIAIQQSQERGSNKPSMALIRVKRKDMENAGWIPGNKYEKEFELLSKITNKFIYIYPGNKTTDLAYWDFGFVCNYRLPFPDLKQEIVAH